MLSSGISATLLILWYLTWSFVTAELQGHDQ